MKATSDGPSSCSSENKLEESYKVESACDAATPPANEIDPLIALYNAGRFTELESCVHILIGQYPDFGFGWKLLGGALQMQGKDALPVFQKVAHLQPDDAEAHFNLGVVQRNQGQFDAAIASYRRAVALRPDYTEAHINLGNTFKSLGQLDDAVSCYLGRWNSGQNMRMHTSIWVMRFLHLGNSTMQ